MTEEAPQIGRFGKPDPQTQIDASNWVVERYTSPDWDNDKQVELDAWLAQSFLHRVAYIRFEDAWKRSHRLTALRNPGRGRAIVEVLGNLRPIIFRSAAALLLVTAVGGGVALYSKSPSGQAFATSVGGRETIVLSDDSRIELNTDTSLRVREATNRREIWLDRGEALFQIKHDARRPLTVYADNRRIDDLGTQFVMRREPGRLSVSLLEGQVAISPSDNNGPKTVLKPGNIFLASAGRTSVTTISPKIIAKELAWRNGLLSFNRTPLSEAAKEFNRYNHEQLVVLGNDTARHVINGSLPVNNPEELAEIAHSLFGLKFKHSDGKILIYQDGSVGD